MNQHDDNIDIYFRKRVEVGETKFSIPLPRYKIDQDAYTFQFESLSLIPELYSQQAQLRDFDSEAENNFKVENPFQFEFYFGGDYYNRENDANKWSWTAAEKDIPTTLTSLNNFFDRIKPAGSIYPPVTFDWVSSSFSDSGYDIAGFHKLSASSFYGEEYDATKHENFLPAGHRRPSVNNMTFPTKMSIPELQAAIYIRMTIAPNVKLGFANDKLLVSLGFFEGQFKPKIQAAGQVIVENPTDSFIVLNGIRGVQRNEDPRSSKVTVTQFDKKQLSPIGMFVTPRGQLKELDKVSTNYIKNVKDLSSRCNQKVSLEYDTASQTFKFVFPNNPIVQTAVTMPAAMSNQLGYGREVTRITKDMISKGEPVPFAPHVADLEKNSRAIVYDIGMAIISIEGSTNLQTVLFHNKVMATLEPNYDGTMIMKHMGEETPKVYASSFGLPQLTFTISRFSEDMKPVPIALPCGAYIQGSLVGKRIIN